MLKLLRLLPSILLLVSLTSQGLAANKQRSNFSTEEELGGLAKGNEYISASYPGAVLIKVQLLGGVLKSGIHHIPTNTDLLTLLSSAGSHEKAKLSDISIRRVRNGKTEVVNIDLEDILEDTTKAPPELEPNDIIYVPIKSPTIDPELSATIGFVSSVLALTLTTIFLHDRFAHPPY